MARPTSTDDLLPSAPIDLRETFDIPLMMDDDVPASPPSRRSGMGSTADVSSLFQDEEPAPRRRSGAEIRAQARLCRECGNLVPAGMSLCQNCGLDQETGTRIDLVEDDEPDVVLAPDYDENDMPTGILLVGTIALIASAGLSLLAFVNWVTAKEGFQSIGSPLLMVVCLFGVFASVQFLRGKSARLLVVAMALGALVDVAVLIALPSWIASQGTPALGDEVAMVDGQESPAPVEFDEETGLPKTPSYYERFNYKSLGLGIAVLGIEGAIFAYLMSPTVRRRYERH